MLLEKLKKKKKFKKCPNPRKVWGDGTFGSWDLGIWQNSQDK